MVYMEFNFNEGVLQNLPEMSKSPADEAERILGIEDLEVQEKEMKKLGQSDEKFADEVKKEMEKILMEPGE